MQFRSYAEYDSLLVLICVVFRETYNCHVDLTCLVIGKSLTASPTGSCFVLQLWWPDLPGNADCLRNEVPGITGVGAQGSGSEVGVPIELLFCSQSL